MSSNIKIKGFIYPFKIQFCYEAANTLPRKLTTNSKRALRLAKLFTLRDMRSLYCKQFSHQTYNKIETGAQKAKYPQNIAKCQT